MTLKQKVDQSLEWILQRYPDSEMKEAIAYSLLSDGKRFRPILGALMLKGFGIDPENYLDFFGAIEMVHCYSLIHDDLPSMDNDDMRRGKPTLHKKYNDGKALLAGDALLTEAFNVIAQSSGVDAETKINMIQCLASNAGLDGMCMGQWNDLYNVNDTEEKLMDVNAYKTAALISVPVSFARYIAKSTQIQESAFFGYNLGILFQLLDDIDDEDGMVKLVGLEKTKQLAEEAKQEMWDNLNKINGNFSELKSWISEFLAKYGH